ncbi:MAG: RNA polymerase sigma factor, partial [Candidatus Sumerlaeia bacterium]|nr:RNA polymerase sigma factor [Candidatus Sumerlaeia bacterium]
VYLEAYRSLGNLRNPGKLSSWLNTLTHNLCYESLRKKTRARQKMGEVFLQRPRVMLVYEVLVKEEELKQLESALNALPEPFRVIIALKYMNQYSCAEIANILGISIAAVKSRLFEARKLLASKMTAVITPKNLNVNGGSHNEMRKP